MTEQYRITERVCFGLSGKSLEGQLTDVRKIGNDGHGIFYVDGKPQFTHRIPGLQIGDDGNTLVYQKDNLSNSE